MKRETIKKGCAIEKGLLSKDWLWNWEDFGGGGIRAWVDRIQCHIQEIIK
jgi:hypothetical protein